MRLVGSPGRTIIGQGHRVFSKVLIANRGEIAVRIARGVQQAGGAAVAVYSAPDRAALHVRAADEAYPLDGATSAETYLRGERLIEIARACGAEAVHPGYGFLAENADFAQMCADAGLVFIGPSPGVMRAMGDKIVAKRTMAGAGVPVVPGWAGDGPADAKKLAAEAKRIGYPVLVKAAAGGGGKGMRVVEGAGALAAGVEAAQREAGAAFGDARIFLEKYLPGARHVEFQIFGDARGRVVHLFERECSIQRRHQKIIEESPSPALTPELRAAMGAAAVEAARAIGYTSAGTVEFLLTPDGTFYFLEVNTRLQVEHPVTEMVTGYDLVKAQLLVAAGEPLPFSQESLTQSGWALECRVYAEDPRRGFVPSTGSIACYHEPAGPNLRVDSGVAEGSRVEVYYDPLLAKLIAWGRDRTEALARMAWALRRYVVLGVTTNLAFLQDVIGHPEFVAGCFDTHFLERRPVGGEVEPPHEAIVAAALAAQARQDRKRGVAAAAVGTAPGGPWQQGGAWRGV